jgi:hypothetical protein
MNNSRLIQGIVAFGGLFNTVVGLMLIFTPVWFFENVGHFPPFNRHYMGDAGTFVLGYGIGLLLAARDPQRHALMIFAAALASMLHTVNHIYDASLGGEPLLHWLIDVGPLAIFTVAMLAAARMLMVKRTTITQ